MPNDVGTILKLFGDKDQIAEFVAGIKAVGENKYDFLQLFPLPAELEGSSSPTCIKSDEECAKALAEFSLLKEKVARGEADAFFLQAGLPITKARSEELISKYGFDNWYDWMQANVGTKWGMYDIVRRGENEFFYNTAWSPATAYYLNVSEQFPRIVFYHEFADEGGFFVGFQTIQNGVALESVDCEWESEQGIRIRKAVGFSVE